MKQAYIFLSAVMTGAPLMSCSTSVPNASVMEAVSATVTTSPAYAQSLLFTLIRLTGMRSCTKRQSSALSKIVLRVSCSYQLQHQFVRPTGLHFSVDCEFGSRLFVLTARGGALLIGGDEALGLGDGTGAGGANGAGAVDGC
jgi:hypothetical protein